MEELKQLDLKQLISACIDLGEKSGEIARRIYESGDLKTIDKSDDAAALPASLNKYLSGSAAKDAADPQTVADLLSQKMIVGSLRAQFPGLTVVGEEGDLEITADDLQTCRVDLIDKHQLPQDLQRVDMKDVVVWIDPLDGTKEFTLGIKDAVTILLGVSIKGKAVAGVVHVPFSKRTVWGAVGLGVFGLQLAPVHEGRHFVATSRSHLSEQIKKILEDMHVDQLIRQGGAGSKALMILEGHADVYFFPSDGTKRWDTCAIEAIMVAAGGCLTDSYGKVIDYSSIDPTHFNNKTGVLASRTPEVHKDFVLDKSKYEIKPFK